MNEFVLVQSLSSAKNWYVDRGSLNPKTMDECLKEAERELFPNSADYCAFNQSVAINWREILESGDVLPIVLYNRKSTIITKAYQIVPLNRIGTTKQITDKYRYLLVEILDDPKESK